MTDPRTTHRDTSKRLLDLIRDLPTLVTDLVKGEIELAKAELLTKVKALGFGAAFLAVALVLLILFLGLLLTSAVLALALVLPGWLSALIIAAAVLVIIAILGFVGLRKIKKGVPPLPTHAIEGIQRDINVVRGLGKRGPVA